MDFQVSGVNAQLTASAEALNGCAPHNVDFNNYSVGDVFEWDFGDGNTSTQPNPTHTYAATGDYTVILTAINAITGCPISYDQATVYIRDIKAEFQSDSIICRGVDSPFNARAFARRLFAMLEWLYMAV